MPLMTFVQLLEACKKFIVAKVDYFEGKIRDLSLFLSLVHMLLNAFNDAVNYRDYIMTVNMKE